MARRRLGTGRWYTESGTEERPSAIPGMVDLYRAGSFIASVPAAQPEVAAPDYNAQAAEHRARMDRLDREAEQY